MAFELINTFNIADNANLLLDAAFNPTFASVGGTSFLFVPATGDDGITVFKVTDKGKLKAVDTFADNGTVNLDDVEHVATGVVNGTTFLFAASDNDNGVSSFKVSNAGVLTNQDNVDDNATFNLAAARGVATAVVGVSTFVFFTGIDDNGVSVFQANNVGLLVNKDNVDDGDNAAFELSAANGIAAAVVGGNTFLFVGGFVDDGVSVFQVDSNGDLTNKDNVDDADIAGLELDGVLGLTTAQVGTKTFLFTAGFNDNGVSVFEVAANGTLTNVDNVTDDATLNLDGADAVATVKIKGITYLFASGFGDSGFSTFVVAADGTLINIDNVDDDDNANFNLLAADGLTTGRIGNKFFLFVAGSQDDGLSVFKIKAAGLTIIGSGAGELIDNTSSAPGQPLASGLGDKIFGLGGNDALKGLGGNDLLDGGAGQDFLFGGKGADRFVFALATDTAVGATRDVIVDFRHTQHDRINLKAIDANINAGGNQAFHFIDHAKFSGHAGELRFAKHVIRGDIDGDGTADFEIGINGNVHLVKGDFIL
jgi:hypothetical protein